MTKASLVDYIAEKADLTKADAARALDAMLEGVEKGLKEEGKVTLTGCKEGDKVVVYYMTQATANVFKVSANKVINGFHQLNMVTTGKSWADGGEVPMELEFKKVSPQTNVTFGFDAKDVTSFDIKLDLLADSNNDIFEIKDIKSGETQGA